MGDRDDEWIGILEAGLLGFILIAAVVGNALVCAVVHRRREIRRTVTHVFIVSLAVTDISVALLCMPFSIITAVTQTWNYSVALCLLNGFLNVFFLLASILTLTAISVYKYIRVVKPVRCLITRRTALIALAFVWLLALFTALAPLTGWSSYEYIEGRTQCSVKVPQNAAELTNCLFIIICGFVVPLGVMSFSYHKIFHTVRTHTKRVRLSQVFDKRGNNAFLSEQRITITLFIILAVFLGCWSPFSVLTIYATTTGKELSKHFSVAAYWLGFLNSALNPVIYALRTKEFRDGYREILGRTLPCCFDRRMGRTINMTFKWSQDYQRSAARNSAAGQAIAKANSLRAEGTAQDRKRAAINICTLKEEDIALKLGIDEGDPACEVCTDRTDVNNKREEVPSAFRSDGNSLDRPDVHLNRDQTLSTSTDKGNLPVAATPDRCFALDHNDKAERELGCSRQQGSETESTNKLSNQDPYQARNRSHSDSAIKHQKHRFKRREHSRNFSHTANGCFICKPRSNTNEGGAAGGVNGFTRHSSIKYQFSHTGERFENVFKSQPFTAKDCSFEKTSTPNSQTSNSEQSNEGAKQL